MTPHLKDLHWLPIPYRIDFKIAVLTYRCLNGCAPSYLSSLLNRRSFNVGGRVLRSNVAPSTMYDLAPPPIHIKSFGKRLPNVRSPLMLIITVPTAKRGTPTPFSYKAPW